MNFLSILLNLSPDQIRLSSNFGDNFIYDQVTLFNHYVNSSNMPYILNAGSAKESLPLLKEIYSLFPDESSLAKYLLIDTGFISFMIIQLALLFIELFTITKYSGTELASVIGLVSLGFLLNFCISIRIEMSKIRLTFLSFISVMFTFLLLITISHFLNGEAPLYVFNSGSDLRSLVIFAWNSAQQLSCYNPRLVHSSEVSFLMDNFSITNNNISNLYKNSSYLNLTNDILKLQHDIYVNGEFHKSASFFNKMEIHSSFLETYFFGAGFSTEGIANAIINTVLSITGTEKITVDNPENFLDHTPLKDYQSFRGSQFFILSSFFCLFFLMLLFVGFSDQQFLNQNKNFEFIWLLWLFVISGLLLLMTDFNLIEVFIALECLSFCSYILISLERSKKLSSISGIRYLIISALPSALLILGIIFLYKQNVSFDLTFIELTNTNDFMLGKDVINNALEDKELTFWQKESQKPLVQSLGTSTQVIFNNVESKKLFDQIFNFNNFIVNENDKFLVQFQNFNIIYFYTLILISLFFIISNLSFKLSAAPFHFWAPVIYNNGLLSSVIFLNILLKLVIFLFLIVFVGAISNLMEYEIKNLFLFFALMSFFFGAGGAINERFIKRFFVYSSMVDVGFILLVFSFYDLNKVKNILLYLLIYNLSSMIIWFFLLVVRKHTKFLTNLSNILNNNNLMKFIFSFVIFSMAGIPPFGGFFIKYNILKDIVNSENMWLSFIVLLFTILTLFYYLRLIKIVMFDNINNTKASNIKNNNFKYILFALLLNFVVFFLIFMQESFLIIFDEITYFFIVHDLDLASVTDRLFANDVIKKFIDDNAKLYYSMLDNYLGSEHYIRQDNLRKIYNTFNENGLTPNFKFIK